MPYFPQHTGNEDVNLGLWNVNENEEFFLSRLNIYENEQKILNSIHHPQRRLEWLSSRLCLKELLKISHKVESLNEHTGKPYLSDRSHQISYSHSNNYSGAIASLNNKVSMDLEALTKDRDTRTRFLFMHPTELDFYERIRDIKVFFLIWSSKETLYKLHGKKGLVFKEHLIINSEEKPLEQSGTISGIIVENGRQSKYEIRYHFFPDVLLTYTFVPLVM